MLIKFYLMSYEEMLDQIYNKLEEKKDTFTIKLEEIEIKDKKFFPNAKKIMKSLMRPPDHIIGFMSSEMKMSVNWISSNKNDGLIFSNNSNQKYVQSIIVKYINKYVKCNMCNSTNTRYVYKNKKAGLKCKNCRCEYTID